MMKTWRLIGALTLGLLVLAAPAAEAAAQQAGTISGTVTDAATGEPVMGAQVSVVGTQRGSVTARDGTYSIRSIPVGEREVRISFLGFQTVTQTVSVGAGETVTVDATLTRAVLDMGEIVVTGVVGEMRRGKLPFTVDRLSEANLPVAGANPASMLTGKIAGAQIVAGSGRPGAPPSVLLRGATSIDAAGRSQEPLYIVDGVILSSSILDLDGMDIESIEVVKGAAASSLYGSRAANGVIQISTRRGRDVADDQVRYTLRTNFGRNDLPGRFNLTQAHHYAMTDDGRFLTAGGTACEFMACTNVALAGQRSLEGESAGLWNTVQNHDWPGGTFDHVSRFFDPGDTWNSYLSIAGRSGGTNYLVSFSRLDEAGVMPNHGGQERNTFRLNVDQSMRQDLTVSASASYMMNTFDERDGPIFQLTRMPAGVDIASPDPDFPDFFVLKPDPNNDNANPLNTIRETRPTVDRARFLASMSARWSPLDWLDVDGQVSFDRLDRNFSGWTPKGLLNLNASEITSSITLNHRRIEGMNAAATVQARQQFGDLDVTSSVRYLFEREDDIFRSVNSSDFVADGVFSIDNTPSDRRSGSSFVEPERREGIFFNTIFDFRDRYILDALVRQDGNSRFGRDSRRAWYYRVAGKYIISEEEWFDIQAVDDLGFRYSIGTAGNTPRWSAQYETFNVSAGTISPGILGNRNLKPEVATEQEMGIDLTAGRYFADLTYARTEVDDALLLVPQLSFTGFSNQWRNAGAMKSNTIEFSLGAQVIQTPTVAWNTRFLFDRTRQRITEINVPAYQDGVAGQGLGNVFFVRGGERLGTFFGFQFAEHCGHLPAEAQQYCNQFQVNDDGLMVWVGDAGSWQNGWQTHVDADGETRHWWGTAAPFDIGGETILWGQPFEGQCIDRATGEPTTFCPLGDTTPDYSISWANTVTWQDFTFYGLLRSVQGFSVYNQPLQWATFQDYSGIMDQRNVDEDLQKPLGYYSTLYGASGLRPSSFFVDDASFIKLQELRVTYRPGRTVLDRFPVGRSLSGLALTVTGNNLWTHTDYDGYDPDIGRAGGGTGSAALARVDGFAYPPFRTFTFGAEITF